MQTQRWRQPQTPQGADGGDGGGVGDGGCGGESADGGRQRRTSAVTRWNVHCRQDLGHPRGTPILPLPTTPTNVTHLSGKVSSDYLSLFAKEVHYTY